MPNPSLPDPTRLLASARRLLSRSLSERLEVTLRDLAAATGRLPTGGPRLSDRDPSRWPPPRDASSRPSWRSGAEPGLTSLNAPALRLTIESVIEETADARTLVFAPVPDLIWKAGQFLTFELELGGQRLRRAYSLSSPPPPAVATAPASMAVTIKRVAGGRVSNHLVDHARPGLTLAARPPSGIFTFEPEAQRSRHLLLVGAGSGITPLVAILETLLRDEPRSTATLIYGNRSAADTIFAARLDALAAAHPERLAYRLVLEDDPRDSADPGRLDLARLTREVPEDPPLADTAPAARACFDAVYVCGPEPVMDAMRQLSAARGLADRHREERFVSLAERHAAATLPTSPVPVTLRFAGRRTEPPVTIAVRPGQTLLAAGLAHHQPMPFSCAMGGCGACKVQVVSGELVHDEPNGLTPAERERGLAFACIARPLGPCTVEVPR